MMHLSPFRYPGGKSWLIPYFRVWLENLNYRPVKFIEPFAGGATVGLTLISENLVDQALLVELDEQVASVWRVIINNEGDLNYLLDKISTFPLSKESVQVVLGKTPETLEEKAFQTILKNRVNRGGILALGAGLLKQGEKGKGLTSRWYPETLCKRITYISSLRDRIFFIEGDGQEILQQYMHETDVAFFIDPPYTIGGKKAGSRLYTHSVVDHEEIFKQASLVEGEFLMTYENDENVQNLVLRFEFDSLEVSMNNTHNTTVKELLIGRRLDWVRQSKLKP